MLADLHCHSTASDGTLSPDELLSRAAANGVDMLSITDHDTTGAYRDLRPPANLRLIAGIEFSCQWHNRGLHIVGLDIDIHSPAMEAAVDHQRRARETRAEMIAEKLERLGAESPLQGAMEAAGEGIIGRPHFASYLALSGFVRSADQAFKKYLGNGKPCDIRVCWPDLPQVISWIQAAGGIAVLAHPGKYDFTRSRLVRCLEDFKAAGGRAVEVVSGQQTPDATRKFCELCDRLDLHQSLGSDFHSPDQHWLDLGRYAPSPVLNRPVWRLWE